MITNIYHTALRNGEFIEFHKQVLDFLDKADPKQLKLAAPYEAYKLEWEKLNQVFGKDLGSELTQKIEKADLFRDKMYYGIKSLFETSTYHYEENKALAGELLLKSMEKYGRVARKGYQEESAVLSALIRDWEQNEKTMNALQTVDALGWKEELHKANEQFRELYSLRTVDLLNIPDESFGALRAPVIEAFQALTKHLEAHVILAKDKAPYEHLVNLINKHVEQYQAVLQQRKGESVEIDQP